MRALSLRGCGCGIVTSLAALGMALVPTVVYGETIIYSGDLFVVVASDPIAVGGTPLQAVTFTASGKDGTEILAFGGLFSGDEAIRTTGNDLHQVWDGSNATPDSPTHDALGGTEQEFDSYLIVNPAEFFFAMTDPFENKVEGSLYGGSGGGWGDHLGASFAFEEAFAKESWPFARVVVPNGTTVDLYFELTSLVGTLEQVNTSFTVPEPGSLMLLALASLVSLRVVCRRRARR